MGRKPTVDAELLRLAELAVEATEDAHELRSAQAVLLPGRLGLTLEQTGEAIGRARATVVRLQAEFRARARGDRVAREGWGGRRRQNLSVAQEEGLLAPFLAQASRGGVLVVAPIKAAYEGAVGHRVPDSTIYRVLARHGWRKVVPDRHHPNADPQTQQFWKKNSKRP